MPLGYSYKRFSSPEQRHGRSLERQTAATEAWCKRHSVQLDNSLRMTDAGVSGFRGANFENPDIHALAGFMAAVRSKRVQAGSYLIVESFDRLTREHWSKALPPLLELVNAGIRLVQLNPEQVIEEGGDPFAIMGLIMTLARAHNESHMKSVRNLDAWQDRRKKARESRKPVGGMIPGWCEYRDGKIAAHAERAAVVKRIFKLAATGNSLRDITHALNGEKAVLFSNGRRKIPESWSDSMVQNILKSRKVLGEFQPHKGIWKDGSREPDGEVVRDYYPRVVTEEQWHATRHAIAIRRTSDRGRRSKHVNLFSGLLWDVRSGTKMGYWHEPGRAPKIFPIEMKTGRVEAGTKWQSYNSNIFERAILNELVELKSADVMPDADTGKVEVLSGRLAEVGQGISELKAKIAARPVLAAALGDTLADLLEQQKKIGEELADAQREAASPLSEAFGQFKKIAHQIETDEQRKRVRNALLKIIQSVRILIVGKGKRSRTRLCYAFIYFPGGAMRSVCILHQQAGNHCKEAWSCVSLREEDAPDELKWQHAEWLALSVWNSYEAMKGDWEKGFLPEDQDFITKLRLLSEEEERAKREGNAVRQIIPKDDPLFRRIEDCRINF